MARTINMHTDLQIYRPRHYMSCNYFYVVHTEYIYIYFHQLNIAHEHLPERVQILCHSHIICITVLETDSSIIIARNVCVLTSASMIVIFSSQGHDRQSSDQNFSSWCYDRQSSEQNNRKLISICITVLENRIICRQIFCDLLLKSAFEQI
jgi:hypothetical protein